MKRFIARQNLKRFKEQLDSSPDEMKRATLAELIAAEEARLKELESD